MKFGKDIKGRWEYIYWLKPFLLVSRFCLHWSEWKTKNGYSFGCHRLSIHKLMVTLYCLQLRNVMDPKRHYKKSDSKSKTLPKYFQVNTASLEVITKPLWFSWEYLVFRYSISHFAHIMFVHFIFCYKYAT